MRKRFIQRILIILTGIGLAFSLSACGSGDGGSGYGGDGSYEPSHGFIMLPNGSGGSYPMFF